MRYESDLKYCPQCQDEYRADIESCAACKITLLTGSEMLDMVSNSQQARNSRLGELGAGDDIVTIHKGPLADLKKLEKAFARENIGMMIVGDEGGCNKGCCPSTFFLQVRREDAQAAHALIQEDFRQLTGIDDHDTRHSDAVFNQEDGQATCPACGFEFETSTTTCPDCGLCFA
ncbi:MAG: hypothetical protein ABFS09_12150 [Thermodesulfobacteriota bacterium]